MREKFILLTFSCSETSTQSIYPTVDFGPCVALGEIVKKKLYLKNTSGIRVPYSLTVEYFAASPPTPPSQSSNVQTYLRRYGLQIIVSLAFSDSF